MGSCAGKSGRQKVVVLIGLENTGKTTMLYQLSKNKKVPAIPTVGKNEEFYIHKGKRYQLLDFGGKVKNLEPIRNHFDNASGIVFMMDINAGDDQLQKSYDLFKNVQNEKQLVGLPVLILLNKQDQFKQSVVEQQQIVSELFKIDQQNNSGINHLCKIMASSAYNRETLVEAFDWLANIISKPMVQQQSSQQKSLQQQKPT